MIRFACPGCTTVFTVSDDKAGKTGKCPKCGVAFTMPAGPSPVLPADPPPAPPLPPPPPQVEPAAGTPAAPMEAEMVDTTVEVQPCPRCKTSVSVEAADVGSDIECPQCRTVFRAVRADAPPPPGFIPAPSSKLIKLGSGTNDDDDDDDRGSRKKKKKRRRDDDDDDEDEDERPARKPRRARRASSGPRGGTMTLRRVGVLSVGKISAILFLAYGLVYSIIILFWTLLGAAAAGSYGGGLAAEVLGFGVVGAIIVPLLAAVFGFIGGIIGAALYNLAAGMVGGIEMEFE